MPTKLYLDPNTVSNGLIENTAYSLIFFRNAILFWKHDVMLIDRLPTISGDKFIIDTAMLFVF